MGPEGRRKLTGAEESSSRSVVGSSMASVLSWRIMSPCSAILVWMKVWIEDWRLSCSWSNLLLRSCQAFKKRRRKHYYNVFNARWSLRSCTRSVFE